MTVTLRIAGWEARGLRCPDHKVSFETANGVYPVTLLQMPNGTGKTTTLKLLRAALSGAADKWERDVVQSLSKRDNENGSGFFRLSVLHNERRYTISMDFDFEEGTVSYSTTDTSGNKRGFRPPRGLERFLRSDFVHFFVFDGELAEQLLDHTHTDAERAIDGLFQLGLFAQIQSRIEEYWRERTDKCTATEERGLSRRRNRVTSLETQKAELETQYAALVTEYDTKKQELIAIKNQFDAELKRQRDVADRLAQAEASLGEAKQAVVHAADRCLDRMRDPHAISSSFAQEMVDLKSSLDRVKLPESTAREFFQELAEEDSCVCGRPLDDATRESIRQRARHYLGSDDVALLNSIKSDIGEYVSPGINDAEEELLGRIAQLQESTRRRGELHTNRDLIESEGIAGHPELVAARERIERLGDELRTLETKLHEYDAASQNGADADIVSLREIERRLEDAKNKLAEITATVTIKQKRDILTAILEQSHADARDGLGTELCQEANDRIQRLMPENQIRIDRIDRCLALQGQEGGSVGETLSVAYAFLATLFNRSSEHELPFVVDSPANPIDLRVRSRIGELAPRLTRQFIAFTISSERQGFLPALETAAGDGIQYLTLFRKGPPDLEAQARESTLDESSDGLCVTGRDFFNRFHLESEDT